MKLRLLLLVAVMLTAGCASALLNGQIALRQGRYVEAEGYFNEALAKDPGRTDALVGLGIAQYKAGQIEESIGSLEKAVQVRPNEPSVRLYLALGYLKRGETDRAEERGAGRAAPGADGAGLLLLLLSLLSLRPLPCLLLGLSRLLRHSFRPVCALRAGVAGRLALLHLIRPLSPSP